jgi:hypothetical protein
MLHHSPRTLNLPSSPTTPTPKHMPAPIRPKISDPCNACMRGFDKLAKSAMSPSKVTINPVSLLLFCIVSPSIRLLSRHENKEQRNDGDNSQRPKYQLSKAGGFVIRLDPFSPFHIFGGLSRHIRDHDFRKFVHNFNFLEPRARHAVADLQKKVMLLSNSFHKIRRML